MQRSLLLPSLLRQNLVWVQKGARETSRQEMPLHSAQRQIPHGGCRADLVEGSGLRAKPDLC